jgi:hypothetical protein
VCSLPYGRLKLLISAWLTTAFVSLPLPVLSALTARVSYSRELLDPNQSFAQSALLFVQLPFLWNLIANVFLFFTFMYAVLWFLTTSRTALGKVMTLLIAVGLLVVTPKFTSLNPDAPILPVVIGIGVSWLGFSVFYLLAPRLRVDGGVLWTPISDVMRTLLSWRPTTYTPDASLALLLGIGNPWILAFAIILCIAIDTLFVSTLSAWLVFLAILAIVSSAIAGLATTRSRALWLRRLWSRTELFVNIEALLWKQNAISLSVLLLTVVVIGSYADRTAAMLALGLPLIVLSAASSLYLSLLQTRGLRWMESILAITTTLVIMATAVLTARNNDGDWIVATSLLVLLALATAIFRTLALRRWSRLDWALCRPLRLA